MPGPTARSLRAAARTRIRRTLGERLGNWDRGLQHSASACSWATRLGQIWCWQVIASGKLARGVGADVVVIALVGERGRELREFTERVLGPKSMARAVVVTATSDQSPLVRRRCMWTAMAMTFS